MKIEKLVEQVRKSAIAKLGPLGAFAESVAVARHCPRLSPSWPRCRPLADPLLTHQSLPDPSLTPLLYMCMCIHSTWHGLCAVF